MKAKRFFTHTGLALGYLVFFFIVQFWCTGLYGFGAGISISLAAPSDPVAATDLLSTRLFEQMDIILLLTYAACLLFYGCFLYAEQPQAPLRAVNLKLPRCAAMLWAPIVFALCFFFTTQGCMTLIPESFPLMEQYIESVSALELGKYPVLSFMATVFGAPIVEEIVFRGLIYKHLKRAMPFWLAIGLQAMLFAMAHGQLLWMTYTFALGVVFALLYEYFDSLWPCILAHLCFNGSNYLPFLEDLTLEPIGWVIVMLASLLLCALTGLMLLIYRNSAKRPYERNPEHV